MIRAEAFNLEALRRKSQRVDEFAEFEIAKEMQQENANWTRLEIELMVPFPSSTRLDRLLASELQVSRTRLQALHDGGMLQTDLNRADVLRRRIKNGTRVAVDLAAETGREQWWRSVATGSSP